MKKVGVAFLGLGEVGEGTYQILLQHREFFQRTQNIDLVVEGVLGCDRKRAQALGIPAEKIAANIAEIVCNAEVDVVVETTDSVAEARENVLYALNAGKTVVMSNRELLCKFYGDLQRAAKRHNAGLYYGAICAGIPAVRTLLDGVQSNAITEVMAIVNGAENDIFGIMAECGCGYEEAAEAAEKIGHGNTDPDGTQAAYQLAILASLAFHTRVPYTKVFRESAANLSAEDIYAGEELGYRLKPLAIAKQTAAGIEVRVHPAFVGMEHPLASVGGNGTAVHLTGDCFGGLLLAGNGAGAKSAGSAVVSDIIYAATHTESKDSAIKIAATTEKDVKFVSDFSSAYYFRITLADRVGAAAKVASVFSKYNISIESSGLHPSEEGATLILVTGETHEAAVKNAVTKISGSGIANVESVLRVAF